MKEYSVALPQKCGKCQSVLSVSYYQSGDSSWRTQPNDEKDVPHYWCSTCQEFDLELREAYRKQMVEGISSASGGEKVEETAQEQITASEPVSPSDSTPSDSTSSDSPSSSFSDNGSSEYPEQTCASLLDLLLHFAERLKRLKTVNMRLFHENVELRKTSEKHLTSLVTLHRQNSSLKASLRKEVASEQAEIARKESQRERKQSKKDGKTARREEKARQATQKAMQSGKPLQAGTRIKCRHCKNDAVVHGVCKECYLVICEAKSETEIKAEIETRAAGETRPRFSPQAMEDFMD